MADNVAITPGSGTTVATDEKTIDGNAVQVQRVNLAVGKNGTYVGDTSGRTVDGDSNASALFTDQRTKLVRLQVTPTVSTTPAYTAKDAVGGLMTFANAVRASGGSGRLAAVQVIDKAQQLKDYDLVLFDRTVTAPTDNAAFDPTDTELGYVVDVVPIGGWTDLNDNAVCHMPRSTPFVLNGTDLFGVLVSRSATGPTFVATTDVVVTLTIEQH